MRMMRLAPILLATLLLAVLAAAPRAVAAAAERVALVIGNARYDHAPSLVNPINDAADIGTTLERIGFEVTLVEDTGYDALRRALHGFRDRAAGAEVSVIYFAGHGIEIARQNYLLPVDARLEKPGDVTFQAIPLDMLREAAAPAGTLSLVIVDACRNNPFLERMQTATRSLSRGLTMVTPHGQNRLVAFAAKEGTVAADGDGRNSPYARALMTELSTPGVEIGKLFRRVRDRVLDDTGGEQEPALYGSLSAADFYFLPPEEEPAVTLAAHGDATGPDAALELEFWRAIQGSTNPADYEDYLSAFPGGVFAPLARRRLAGLAIAAQGGEAEPQVTTEAPLAPSARAPDAGRTAVAALAPTAAGAALGLAAEPGRLGEAAGPLPQARIVPPEPEEAEADQVAGLELILPARTPEVPEEVRDRARPLEDLVDDVEMIDLTPERLRDIQARLNILGFDAGPVDGLMGARTRSALETFLRSAGLPVTGAVSVAAVAALESSVTDERVAAYHSRIEAEAEAAREAEARAARQRERERQEREAAAAAAAAAAARTPTAPDPAPAYRPTTEAPAPRVARQPEPEPETAAAEPAQSGPVSGAPKPMVLFGNQGRNEGRGGK